MCGPVLEYGPPTNNVAELVAFKEALTLVREHPELADLPTIMRYDSRYAALVGTSVWKAKSNKALAAAVWAEWKKTRDAKRGRLYLRHVKAHSGHTWNDLADKLADDGRRGVSLNHGVEGPDVEYVD